MTRPLLIWIFMSGAGSGRSGGEHAHHGHAHGNAEGDLVEDDGLGAVGHGGIDLDAAVHRSWVYYDGVGPRARELLGGQAPYLVELLWRRQQRAVHALV